MPGRRLEWFTRFIGFTVIASGAQDSFDLYSAAALGAGDIKDSTITRMIIKIIMLPTNLVTMTELFYGIVILNQDAVTAGALPEADVTTDRADWLVRGWLAAKSANLSDITQTDRVELDLRAQRKLHSEEDALTIVYDASASGQDLQVAHFVRTLVRLP